MRPRKVKHGDRVRVQWGESRQVVGTVIGAFSHLLLAVHVQTPYGLGKFARDAVLEVVEAAA